MSYRPSHIQHSSHKGDRTGNVHKEVPHDPKRAGRADPANPKDKDLERPPNKCTFCHLDEWDFIRIPNVLSQCCIACANLLRFELEEREKNG